MRKGLVLAVIVVVLLFGGMFVFAPPADGRPDAGPNSYLGAAQIERVHDRLCRKVVEYTDCKSLTVTVSDFGPTGWIATSQPYTGIVNYNSHYKYTKDIWESVVAHEVGGHHDTWNEIVARVGYNQAWTDYYELDHYAQLWLAGHGYSFDQSLAKELWLDCAGPVDHGYTGLYMQTRQVMPSVCSDYRTALELAISNGGTS